MFLTISTPVDEIKKIKFINNLLKSYNKLIIHKVNKKLRNLLTAG